MQTLLTPQERENLISTLFRFDRGFWKTIVILLFITIPGLILYIRQLILGLGTTNLNRPVFWGTYVVNFVFLIGISMAGTVISSVLYLLKVEWRRPITRIAESLTVFGLMAAGLQIIMDMGRPDRFLNTLLYGRLQAPLMWDIASLTLYLLTASFALYLQLLPDIAFLRDSTPANAPTWRKRFYSVLSLGWQGNKEQWRRLEKAITVTSIFLIPIGVSLHTVTSWLFSTSVQPGWKSTILGPYFVVGAIFSGIGLLFITTVFACHYNPHLKNYITETFYKNLGAIFLVMCFVWFYFTLNETLVITTEQELLEFPVMASKLFGEFAPTFWAMNLSMTTATWILLMLKLPYGRTHNSPLWTRTGLIMSVLTVATFVVLSVGIPDLRTSLWKTVLIGAFVVFFVLALIGLTGWFRMHLIPSTLIASGLVLIGMWLERWNILIPTLTHPRLISYTAYVPNITEIAITLSTFGILGLIFVVFYKFFPLVALWELEAGRARELKQGGHT